MNTREGTNGLSRSTFAGEGSHDDIKDKHLIAKNVMVMHSPEIMQRIHEHNPEMHIVVLLREPCCPCLLRLLVGYDGEVGKTSQTYEEALAAEEARLNEDWFKWRQCAYQYNGIYYPHVKNLITQFGSNRIHCFLTDDLKENAEAVCQQIYNHIGISNDFKPSIGERHNQATMPRSERFNFFFTQFLASHNPLRRAIRKLVPDATAYKLRKVILDWNEKPQKDANWTPPPLNPQTRERQAAYFKPFNEQLGELLGRDLSAWN